MELRSKKSIIATEKGPINAEGREIFLVINNEPSTVELKHIFSHMEFDDGEISGNSLVNFYKVQEDGSLQVAGSKIQFMDTKTGEIILVKSIDNIRVGYDESELSFEDIKKFSEHFNVQHPEEVFPLTASEKEIIIAERIEREKQVQPVIEEPSSESIKEQEQASELERQNSIKALAAYKASLDAKYVQDKKDVISAESFYSSIGFNKYEQDIYTLFYGDPKKEVPCILIKRGDWWEECSEETLAITDKTPEKVVFEFMDNKTPKTLTLDLTTGQINISE